MSEKEILKLKANERTRCTVFTRVMGYHRPTESFNIGKKGEFAQRVHFEEKNSKECCG